MCETHSTCVSALENINKCLIMSQNSLVDVSPGVWTITPRGTKIDEQDWSGGTKTDGQKWSGGPTLMGTGFAITGQK